MLGRDENGNNVFIHSFNKYSYDTYYVLDTVLDYREISVKNFYDILAFKIIIFNLLECGGGKQKINKINITQLFRK